jgi:hypothetical protein
MKLNDWKKLDDWKKLYDWKRRCLSCSDGLL